MKYITTSIFVMSYEQQTAGSLIFYFWRQGWFENFSNTTK